jgi:hypothetical protein
MEKKEILAKLKCLKTDFEMLDEGIWIPDTDSIQASVDNIEDIINYIEKE